jgi:hypothetical protein
VQRGARCRLLAIGDRADHGAAIAEGFPRLPGIGALVVAGELNGLEVGITGGDLAARSLERGLRHPTGAAQAT